MLVYMHVYHVHVYDLPHPPTLPPQLSPEILTPSPAILPNSAVLFDDQPGSLSSSSMSGGDQAVIRDDFTAIAKLGGCGLVGDVGVAL